MHNTYMRQKVLVCVEEYAAMQERLNAKLGSGGAGETNGAYPTAPPQENLPSAPPIPPPAGFAGGAAPSAPPIETFQSTECCVCMERKVTANT